MGFILEIASPYKTRMKRWKHLLFDCPTFWSIRPRFKCPDCGKTYRCYWDGNDTDHGINLCDTCAAAIRKGEAP